MAQLLAIIEDGMVVNAIIGSPLDFPEAIDITATNPRPCPGWTYADGVFAPPAPASAPIAPRIISNLAFDLRFTEAERVAIELASLDDPSAPIAARTQAAYLRVALERAKKAKFTDLDDSVTRAGVMQFEAAGLLTEGRALEILDAPVQDSERP